MAGGGSSDHETVRSLLQQLARIGEDHRTGKGAPRRVPRGLQRIGYEHLAYTREAAERRRVVLARESPEPRDAQPERGHRSAFRQAGLEDGRPALLLVVLLVRVDLPDVVVLAGDVVTGGQNAGEHRMVLVVVPVQTVPADGLEILQPSQEGADGVERLAVSLGMRPFRVADDQRVTYHAAASIASNHLVALLGQAARVAADAGIPAEALLPLVRATLEMLDALRGGNP
jgi:hypothetical protein